MTEYHIRPAVIDDCAELDVLVNSAYRGDISRLGWTTEADSLDGQRSDASRLREDIERPGCVIHCLRENPNGPILGCVLVEDHPDGDRYFGMLSVNPRLQASGLGRVLLEYIEEDARARGIKRIVMRVLEHRDTLIAWYQRRGYNSTGETAPFPYDDETFGIPKRPDLRFLVFGKDL